MQRPGHHDNDGKAARGASRVLRLICFWSFIPALAFNLAHGIRWECILPAIGLIPMAFSVGLAAFTLGWLDWLVKKHHQYRIVLQDDDDDNDGDATKPPHLRELVVTIMDTAVGLALLGCIVGTYFVLEERSSNRWYWGGGYDFIIVGVYGTLPYIVNALIHGFFLMKWLYEWSKRCSTPRPKPPPPCYLCCAHAAALRPGHPHATAPVHAPVPVPAPTSEVAVAPETV